MSRDGSNGVRSTKASARRRGAYLTVPALAVVLLVLAACGGSGGASSGSTSDDRDAGGSDARAVTADEQGANEPEAAAASATTVAVVKVMSTPELGRVLVDSNGMTLYDTHGDNPMLYQFNRPPTPTCYEACARVWPPVLTAAAPRPIGGAESDLLGTIRREDGSRQVTYNGHPLYTYANDTQPGETNGNYAVSFGEEWHALEPDGEEPGVEAGGAH